MLWVADCAVPCRSTDCGLPAALSVNTSEPSRIPLASGLKVTATVQVAPAASEAGQALLEIRKSAWSFPLMAILVIDTAVVPVFFTVVLNAALVFPVEVTGKVRDDGVNVKVVAARAGMLEAHSPASASANRSTVSAW